VKETARRICSLSENVEVFREVLAVSMATVVARHTYDTDGETGRQGGEEHDQPSLRRFLWLIAFQVLICEWPKDVHVMGRLESLLASLGRESEWAGDEP